MPTGASAYIRYGWEATFKTQSTTIDKVFGEAPRFDSSRTQNIRQARGLGKRTPYKLIPLQYEGTFSIETIIANPWWLRAIIGNAPTTSGTGPYTHTYLDGSLLLPKNAPSITIENGIDLTADAVIKLLGCVADTATITAAVNEPVMLKIDGKYATETKGTSGIADPFPSESLEYFTFAEGKLEVPDGTVISDVQNAEISIRNNLDMRYGLGSRFGSRHYERDFDVEIRTSNLFEDATVFLEKFYGSATAPTTPTEVTVDLLFDNGLTGTSQRQIHLTVTGAKIAEETLNQVVAEAIPEDIVLQSKGFSSVVAINNTSTAP